MKLCNKNILLGVFFLLGFSQVKSQRLRIDSLIVVLQGHWGINTIKDSVYSTLLLIGNDSYESSLDSNEFRVFWYKYVSKEKKDIIGKGVTFKGSYKSKLVLDGRVTTDGKFDGNIYLYDLKGRLIGIYSFNKGILLSITNFWRKRIFTETEYDSNGYKSQKLTFYKSGKVWIIEKYLKGEEIEHRFFNRHRRPDE